MSLEIKSISKFYGGQKALDNINFSVQKTEIVGLLGANGAGKSTLMKIISGETAPSKGESLICSELSGTRNAKQKLGYLAENNPLYTYMTAKEFLDFFAQIRKTPKENVEKYINLTKIGDNLSKKLGELSKGYKQRVGLAAALMHEPDVLLLDEPTNGLDPKQLIEFRDIILQASKTKTILLSTHIMQEVDALCSRVIVIEEGKILSDKKMSEIKSDGKQAIEVEFDFKIEKRFLEQSLSDLSSIENVHDNIWLLIFSTQDDKRADIANFASEHGLRILELKRRSIGLEELFYKSVGSGKII